MIDILLIAPSFSYSKLDKASSICPNLGLASIAAILEKNNYKVKVIDCLALNINLKELARLIKKNNPKIIGITASTVQIKEAINISLVAKKINSRIITVLGGAHPSTMNNSMFPDSIDYLSFGEGDFIMLELADSLIKKKTNLSEVRGVAYKRNKLVINEPSEPIKNINKLPFPSYHLFPVKKYRPYATYDLGKKFITAITSRGCSFSCTFCASSRNFSKGWRSMNYKQTFEMINMLYHKYNIRHIYFQDDEFTINKKRVVDFCNLIIKNRLKFSWECLARASDIDNNLIIKMKQAGCEGILIGVETGYDSGLEKIKKKINTDQIQKAIKILKKHDIESRATFILGFPWETKKDINKTIEFAVKIDPDIAYFQTLTPYEKTEIYEELKKKKLIVNQNTDDFVQHSIVGTKPLVKTEHLSSDELSKFIRKAFKKFYFRPSYWIKRLIHIKNFAMLKRYFRIGSELLISLIKK